MEDSAGTSAARNSRTAATRRAKSTSGGPGNAAEASKPARSSTKKNTPKPAAQKARATIDAPAEVKPTLEPKARPRPTPPPRPSPPPRPRPQAAAPQQQPAAEPAPQPEFLPAPEPTPEPTSTPERDQHNLDHAAVSDPPRDHTLDHVVTIMGPALRPQTRFDKAALAAVRRWGPPAREWADRARLRYPYADAQALARLAAVDALRAGQVWGTTTGTGAQAGLAGLASEVAGTGMLLQTRAYLVLCTAAAFGLDPTDERRANDLLVLLRLDTMKGALGTLASTGLAAAVRRAAARIVPGGATVAGLLQSGPALRDLAVRARSHFRQVLR